MGVKNSKQFIEVGGTIYRIDDISSVERQEIGCKIILKNGKKVDVESIGAYHAVKELWGQFL